MRILCIDHVQLAIGNRIEFIQSAANGTNN